MPSSAGACSNGVAAAAQPQPQQQLLLANNDGTAAGLLLPGATTAATAATFLYHLGLSTLNTDFPAAFGGVKFVCTGGSTSRMAEYAKLFAALANVPASGNLCKTDRYVLYRTGPVLWVNHGMGVPSCSIVLCELFKLLRLASCSNEVEFVRMGTSGGVGVKPGTLIVSEGTMNAALEKNTFVQWIRGKQVKRDAVLDVRLGNALFETAKELGVPAERGITLCADDFYEGQMRLDGPFCEYGPEEKLSFMRRINQLGVKNIEMEGVGFAALTHRARYPAALCCVTLVNRMEADSIGMKGDHVGLEQRPFDVVARYILKKLDSERKKANSAGSATMLAANGASTVR